MRGLGRAARPGGRPAPPHREPRPIRPPLRRLSRNLELTRRWQREPAPFAALANDGYGRRTGKPLPAAVLKDALSRLEPTADPLASALEETARRTQALGFAPPGGVSGFVDGSLLAEVASR